MPEVAKAQATVQVHRVGVGPNSECLLYPTLPVILLGSHSFPVYAVVLFMDMDCDTILLWSCVSPNSLLMFGDSFLESSLSLTHAYTFTVSTRDLVDHACLLSSDTLLFTLIKVWRVVRISLKTALTLGDLRDLQVLSIFSERPFTYGCTGSFPLLLYNFCRCCCFSFI